jgi:tetraacyldisaccharide 4'-kinase
MKTFKPKFWHKKNSFLSFFFLPLSILLQLLISLKKKLIKQKKFSIPIICVGNIYLGGTGKTPLCIELAEILKKLNKKTAIIKKFYKNHEDEFRLIESKKIKLFKDVSRVTSIKKAEIEEFDCVILDDGFQDSAIIKNLNIICFNEEQLVGNGMTLPSGPLRESLSSLKNSQIVVINGNSNEVFEEKIRSISNDINIYYSKYLPANLSQFTNQNLLAFAGIGNPDNFFNLLEKNGLSIAKKLSYPDHYNYSIKELNNLIKYSIKNNLKIITTKKDYFRIEHYKIPEIQYLDVKLEIINKNKFEIEIKKYL